MNIKVTGSVLMGLATALALSGCGAAANDPNNGEGETSTETGSEATVQVAAAFYPLEYAVNSVGGQDVSVTPLATPGMEAHDIELTPGQVVAVAEADLVVYLSGFQPAVDEAVKQADPAKVLDVAKFVDLKDADDELTHDDEEEGEHQEESDPHFWLDPLRLASVEDAIAERLTTLAPEQADTFAGNATAARSELETLDQDFTAGLATCERRELFTAHSAFGYLAERYDLEQVGVAGLSPNIEPSPARIAEVQELAREHGATTIFFETATSNAVASSIAQDLGLQTAVLDPIESVTGQSAGEDYSEIMRANLSAIQKANGCG